MRGTKLLFFGFLWIAASVLVLAACGAPEDVSSPEEQPLLSGETAEGESAADPALSAEETLLSQKLQALGLTPEDVPGSQLLVVLPDGSSATICRFELKGVSWVQQGEGIPAYVGKNGVSAGKREGDGTTPAGLFPVGPAFGLEESPRTNLDYRTVTTDSYWVDDPDSVFYNQWVEGTVQKDWSHAERLCDYPQQYALAW